MRGIVSHRWVTHAIERIPNLLDVGYPREHTVRPGAAAIGGSCESDVRSASAKKSSLLKSRDNRVSKSKAVRLDLRLVLTGVVGKGIGTQSNAGEVCLRRWRISALEILRNSTAATTAARSP
jgi:hypothetical protein